MKFQRAATTHSRGLAKNPVITHNQLEKTSLVRTEFGFFFISGSRTMASRCHAAKLVVKILEQRQHCLPICPPQIAVFTLGNRANPCLRLIEPRGNLHLGKAVRLNFHEDSLPIHAAIIAIAIFLVNAFAITIIDTIAIWKH